MSPTAVEASIAKLAYLQGLDDARMAKLEAKNGLEAYLYMVKNKLEDEAEAMGAVTSGEQREALSELVTTSVDWLDDEGFDVETKLYKDKRGAVEGLAEPIFFRLDEVALTN